MNDDTCLSCGAYVPEGRQVCVSCSPEDNLQGMTEEEVEMIRWLASASDKEIKKVLRKTERELFGHVLK